jgi:hypothetical protein
MRRNSGFHLRCGDGTGRAAIWLATAALAWLAAWPGELAAEERRGLIVAPRVVSSERADAYSLRSLGDFHRWRELAGDRRAWEIYRYLADRESGLFHMHEFGEGDDVLPEFRHVRDPIKIINVYGYGYCGILGPVMAGVSEGAGLGPARTVVLPGWSHVVAESFYDNQWHYLDLDVRAAFRRPDGRLASLAEARTQAGLWINRGPLFFPKDDLETTRKIYEVTPVDHYYGFHQTGHTMDYVLRTGERFTRWWHPQGGRWHLDEAHTKEAWIRELLRQQPLGPKPNHREFSPHNHGNGRFVYEPDLSDRSADVAGGAYDMHNVRTAPAGLTLRESGRGFIVFEVRSPYVIVPIVGDFDTRADDREASVVELDADRATLEVSLDNGLTWQAVDPPAGKSFDLTRLVAGRYGFLLKVSLQGMPHEALVRSLRVTTWVQVAPAALPALRRGRNELELRTGDDLGLASRVVEVQSQVNHKEHLLRVLTAPPDDYDLGRKTSRIRGFATARVVAPPGTKIAWLDIDAAFQTHQGKAATETRNTIAYATQPAGPFEEVYRASMPTDVNHWHTHASRRIRLADAAREVFVRFHGDPGLNAFTIYAHCVDQTPIRQPAAVVTHVWREGDQQRKHSVRLAEPAKYEITIPEGAEALVNESIELAVPSASP